MKVLGIETSCDETAIAVVDSNRKILLNEVYSQIKLHAQYGGVIPELAARNHIEILPKLISEAIHNKRLDLNEMNAIAVTGGPGLIGGVIVGVMVAKGLASALNKPFIAVNHLEGHALTARLTNATLEFPYLLLLVSGGHCQILYAKSLSDYKLLGSTKDDAVGEAFDKVAKMLNLQYPGGPAIEKLSLQGNANAYSFPKAFFRESHCDMSFSGIKTAVARQIAKEDNITNECKANICASFQKAVFQTLCDRIKSAIAICEKNNMPFDNLVVSGGVAANQNLKYELQILCDQYKKHLIIPPISLCTDNAAMIAWVGIEKLVAGYTSELSFSPRSRWSIAN